MLKPASPLHSDACAASHLDAVGRRYCFAAWPQTFTHASWFDALDEAVGMAVSRDFGRTVGEAERAVAHALLQQVGTAYCQRVADDDVPMWAMQAHAPMCQHLSTIAALVVLPALKLAVSGAEARHWDTVLGVGVRHAAMLLGRSHPQIEPPPHAAELRRQATAAAKSALTWELFSFRVGLTALESHDAAVRGRFRLIWPRAMRDEASLVLEDSVHSWLVDACMLSTQVQQFEPPSRGLVA